MKYNIEKIKGSKLNPKNWGVSDYSDKGSRDAAFAAARKAGEKEFIFNRKRFNTRKDTDDLNITMPNKDLNPDWDAEKYNDYLKTNYPEFLKVINRGKGVNEIEFGHHKAFKNQPRRGSYDVSKNKIHTGSVEIEPDASVFGRNEVLGTIIAEMAHVKDDKLSNSPFKKSLWERRYEDLKHGENRYNIPNTMEYNTHRLYEPGLAMIAYGDLSPNDIMRIQKHLGVKEDGHFGEITYKALQEKYKESPYIQNALEKHQFSTYDGDENPMRMGSHSNLAKAYLHQINQDVPLRDSKRFYDPLQYSDYTDNALLNIKAGSGDYDVGELQRALVKRGYKLPKSTKQYGDFDGIWGDETKNALLDYQINNYAEGGKLNNHTNMNKDLKDHGPKPFVVDVEKLTIDNKNYRTVIWTGKYMQVTVMSIPPGEDIGLEIHKEHDQFLRIEKGEGIVQMGDAEDNLDFQEKVGDDFAILIPAGKWHNLVNNSTEPLKLYSIYSPVEHPKNTVHKTKQGEITKHHSGGTLESIRRIIRNVKNQ